MLAAGRILPPPDALRRTTSTSASWRRRTHDYEPLVTTQKSRHGSIGSIRCCLMDVDPATARHTVEYAGRGPSFLRPVV